MYGLETLREKPLIVYVTSSRKGGEAQMGADVIIHFVDQILLIPDEVTEVDLLVVSSGGDGMVAWRMINLLRERFEKISVLLPYEAFSAATLLALGADEIIMHPFANLGPVDPQITKTFQRPNNPPETIRFGAEDIIHFLKFLKEDIGLTDQEQLQLAFADLTAELGAQSIGFAKRSTNLTVDLGKKLLNLHMNDSSKVNSIIDALSKKFYHHGFALNRSDAKSIGLEVVSPNSQLSNLIWDVWINLSTQMQVKEPFIPLDIFYQHTTSNNVANARIAYTLFQAALESSRLNVSYKTNGLILGNQQPNGNIGLNVIPINSKWS